MSGKGCKHGHFWIIRGDGCPECLAWCPDCGAIRRLTQDESGRINFEWYCWVYPNGHEKACELLLKCRKRSQGGSSKRQG